MEGRKSPSSINKAQQVLRGTSRDDLIVLYANTIRLDFLVKLDKCQRSGTTMLSVGIKHSLHDTVCDVNCRELPATLLVGRKP